MDESKSYQMVLILKAIAQCNGLIAGMTAENLQRQAIGASMAYTMEDFTREVDFMNQTFEVHRL